MADEAEDLAPGAVKALAPKVTLERPPPQDAPAPEPERPPPQDAPDATLWDTLKDAPKHVWAKLLAPYWGAEAATAPPVPLDYTEPPTGDPREQLYQFYLNRGRELNPPGTRPRPADTEMEQYLTALWRTALDREGAEIDPMTGKFTRRAPPNTSPLLRDVQHALVGQVRSRDAPHGKAILPAEVAVYNALKGVAQGLSSASGVPALLDKLGASYIGEEDEGALSKASPPSVSAMKWGLRPFWGKD